MVTSVLVSLVLVGGAQESPAGASPFLQPQSFAVGGITMRAASGGLAGRAEGTPVVLFEAGAAGPLESWEPVLRKLPKTMPWVAYTRPGIEGTEWDKVKPTPEHVSKKLLELLGVMKVRPPYVVVGHSWGGVIARYFVGNHPGVVSGVVYLDPGPVVTQSRQQELAVFRAIGSDEKGLEAMFTVPEAMKQEAPDFVMREFETFTSLMKLELPARKVPSAPNIPSVMVLAGQYTPHPWSVPFDHRKYFDAELRRRISALSEWVIQSDSGKLEVHQNLHHGFPWTHPEVVVRAIEYVLAKPDRTGD